MKVLIGTTNNDKIEILKAALADFGQVNIVSVKISSEIDDQPLDEEIIIKGSINRARNVMKIKNNGEDFDFAVGLEGGLVEINRLYHLVCAASFIDRNGDIYTGISKKLPLPKEVSERVKNSEQLAFAIREFYKNFKKSEPVEIKNLVKELIERKESFSEAIKIALIKYKNKTIFQ